MRAIAFGGLRQMKMLFFSNPPHTPHEECSLVFCYYSLSLYISLSISLFLVLPLIWTLTSKSAPRMSVTNCSPTLWQCFFSSRAVYDLLFFLFLFFFSVFFPFQGLAHLTLNDQGMGSFFFILVMIFFFFFSWRNWLNLCIPSPTELWLLLSLSSSAFHIPSVPHPSTASWSLSRHFITCTFHILIPSTFICIHFFLVPPAVLPVPSSAPLCISASSHQSVSPSLLSLSYGSRPGPSPLTTFDPHDLTLGDEGNTFLLSLPLLLRGKKKQKMYEKCVFVGQVKNVSRLSFTNTSRWKCCRMCRVSRHHSVDIPIVWHFEGFQRSTVYDLILSWNVCYIYCCVFNVSNEHCMLFLFTVLPLQICCTAMPFLLWTLFLADNLSHIYTFFYHDQWPFRLLQQPNF